MSNSTCASNNTSISDLLANAVQIDLNVTTIVANCPQVCSLAWGNGNPDLSGIGANISYIFQAILSILCGPLLCFIHEFLRHKSRFNGYTKKRLANLHDSFLDVSAQFSVSVAIAEVIRIKQNAPFYELAFLRHLTSMQFLSLLSTSVTVGLPYRRGLQRILIVTLYGILEFGFYMGLVGSLIASNASWAAITNLSKACDSYGSYFPLDQARPIPSPSKDKNHSKRLLQSFQQERNEIPPFHVLRGKTARFLVVLMSLGFTIGMLVELAEMERTRNAMKEITGADFQDNQWGFGRVIALFLWMPLCIQLVYYAARIAYSQITNEPNMDDFEKQK